MSIESTGWQCNYQLDDNGFAGALSISRNYGGTLYLNRTDMGCEDYISFGKGKPSRYVKFTREKAMEFMIPGRSSEKSIVANVYGEHNIDYYPGALFLRNWAINYMNMAFEDVGIGD